MWEHLTTKPKSKKVYQDAVTGYADCLCSVFTGYADNCIVKPLSRLYKPAASGAPKAYDRLNLLKPFDFAKGRCEQDGATLVMPKTAADIEDIKEYDRK